MPADEECKAPPTDAGDDRTIRRPVNEPEHTHFSTGHVVSDVQDAESFRGKRITCCNKRHWRIRLPPNAKRILQIIYNRTAGFFTYILLLVAIYLACYSIQPSIAMLPVCRRVAVPSVKFTKASGSGTTEPTNSDEISSNYEIAMECKRGEALSILIFYGCGFLFGEVMELIRLPGLLGMLIGGLALRNIGVVLISERIYHSGHLPNGSYPINLSHLNVSESNFKRADRAEFDNVDPVTRLSALLLVSPTLSTILRQMALTTILSRAGLGLDPAALKKVFFSVFRLAFIPCFCEALTLMLVTRFLIGWPWIWGAMLGFVCAAVSPAVIVPNMMRLEVSGLGVAQGIPTLVVAASSMDDVIAITGFGVALAIGLATGDNLLTTIIWGPLEALIGATFGIAVAVLICLFPAPKMEHSHALRGILLITLAVSGLLGSTVLHLPGAGALSCLVLSFGVATGWRAGYPWRLVQLNVNQNPIKDVAVTKCVKTEMKPMLSEDCDVSQQGSSTQSSSPGKCNDSGSLTPVQEASNCFRKHSHGHRPYRRSQMSMIECGLANTLIEYHPQYYCALKYQHQNSTNKETMNSNSARSSLSHRFSRISTGYEHEMRNIGRKTSNHIDGIQYILRRYWKPSRRFSLPQPSAYYELDSFHALGHRPWISPSDARVFQDVEPRKCSASFERVENICCSPMNVLEEIMESECDQTEQEIRVEQPIAGEFENKCTAEYADTITPQQRGLECLSSMRRTVATIWWFVQPMLFTLIGSEVNLTLLKGASTGLGVVSLMIGLVARLGATILAVLPSNMNMKERLFVGFAWLPKATVQAAVGPQAFDTARRLNAPVEMLEYGYLILTLAALAILIAAPLGAIIMPLTASCLLRKYPESVEETEDVLRKNADAEVVLDNRDKSTKISSKPENCLQEFVH